ncbi:hypothetical protein CCO03_17000 [Comamonas serinivorans]|uniref:Uncharacterized protein n=1 Tax=Comamonas serinivorans TaxID=1082851 RepID=A0A1Y0ER54_9BURK|nr:hypothetical protein [Comamonas serinivorans]ARU06144.1 hypothetical protein CCO03_17000 [Comamonas serinivorans]
MTTTTAPNATHAARAKNTNTLIRTLRPGESIEVEGKVRIVAEQLSGRRIGVRLEMEPSTVVRKNLH